MNLPLNCFTWQLELKLGLGGTSYADFIRNMHLPMQLRYVETSDYRFKIRLWVKTYAGYAMGL